MNTLTTLPSTFPTLQALAGVKYVKDSSKRNACMEVAFDDGLVVHIFQGTRQDRFDILFPENGGGLAERLRPYLSADTVMEILTNLAMKATSKADRGTK